MPRVLFHESVTPLETSINPRNFRSKLRKLTEKRQFLS